MADQNVNIKATVVVNDDQVKKYNEELDKTAKKSEEAFNPKKALRAATLELQQAQAQFGEYSAEALKAARNVAQLRDSIGEANETANLFDPGKKFAVFSGALNSIAGGYGAVQGAIGLLGVESNKVQEQLLKVQSALAVSEGLSTILDSGKDFQRLAAIIKTNVVGAFNAMRNAVVATGVGALVVALGLIVAYWDDIKKAVRGVSDEERKQAANAKAAAAAEKEKLDALNSQDETLKAQGLTEREILVLKAKQTDQVLAATEAEVKKSQIILKNEVEAEKRNRKWLEQFLKLTLEASLIPVRILATPLDLLLKTANGVAKVLGLTKSEAINLNDEITKLKDQGVKELAGFIFDPAQVQQEGEAAIKEQEKALRELKNQRDGYNNAIKALDKKAADDAAAARKKAAEDAAKAEQEAFDARRAAAQADAKEVQKSTDIVSARKAVIEDETNTVLALVPKRIEAITTVARTQEQKDKDIEVLQEDNRKQFQTREEAKQKALALTGEALNSLSDIVGKNTAAGKALAISSALINTYQGITQIWKNDTVIPEPFGTIQKVAATVTAAASGFAAVRGIVRTQVPGGGGGGGGAAVPSGVGGAAPLSPVTPQAIQTTLDAASINSITNQPARAYVVESDVSNSQERIRRINRAATFG